MLMISEMIGMIIKYIILYLIVLYLESNYWNHRNLCFMPEIYFTAPCILSFSNPN